MDRPYAFPVCGCCAIPALALWIALAAPIRAGPPLLTDDPDTPGPGDWEINIAAQVAEAGGTFELAAPVFDLNYGLGERVQLKFEVPLLILDAPGHGAIAGMGNAEFGIKWRFLDEERDGISVSAYPQVEIGAPSSARRRGLAEDGAEFLFPLQFAKTLGPFLVYAEGGRAWREHREDEWIYGLAAEYALVETLDLVAEIHGIAAEGFGSHEVFLNGGFKWRFHGHLALLAAAGHSIHTPSGEPGIALGYLGLQMTF